MSRYTVGAQVLGARTKQTFLVGAPVVTGESNTLVLSALVLGALASIVTIIEFFQGRRR